MVQVALFGARWSRLSAVSALVAATMMVATGRPAGRMGDIEVPRSSATVVLISCCTLAKPDARHGVAACEPRSKVSPRARVATDLAPVIGDCFVTTFGHAGHAAPPLAMRQQTR